MVICLELGADLHMAQLMPLPLTVSCFSKIQIGFTFLVPALLGSPGKRAVKRGCVCVCKQYQPYEVKNTPEHHKFHCSRDAHAMEGVKSVPHVLNCHVLFGCQPLPEIHQTISVIYI